MDAERDQYWREVMSKVGVEQQRLQREEGMSAGSARTVAAHTVGAALMPPMTGAELLRESGRWFRMAQLESSGNDDDSGSESLTTERTLPAPLYDLMVCWVSENDLLPCDLALAHFTGYSAQRVGQIRHKLETEGYVFSKDGKWGHKVDARPVVKEPEPEMVTLTLTADQAQIIRALLDNAKPQR